VSVYPGTMCLYIQVPCVCISRYHVSVYPGTMCLYIQVPCVCISRCHVSVYPGTMCLYPGAMCLYIQVPCVCVSKYHVSVYPGAMCLYIQVPCVLISRYHVSVYPGTMCLYIQVPCVSISRCHVSVSPSYFLTQIRPYVQAAFEAVARIHTPKCIFRSVDIGVYVCMSDCVTVCTVWRSCVILNVCLCAIIRWFACLYKDCMDACLRGGSECSAVVQLVQVHYRLTPCILSLMYLTPHIPFIYLSPCVS